MYAAETTTTPRRRWPPSAIRAQSPLTARSGNDDGGKEAAIEKATSIAAGGLLFLLLLAHCGSSRFIKESSEVARGCPARLPLDLLLHLAHLPTKPRIKYVVFAWLVFFANGWFQFFPVVLLHQFTYRNPKVFSTKECCFYCIDVCQACIDCFGLVIPYANSSKCHQILCNNMFLISCDNINCCQIFKKKHHYTFYSTIPQIWFSRGKSTRIICLIMHLRAKYFILFVATQWLQCLQNKPDFMFFLRQLHVH